MWTQVRQGCGIVLAGWLLVGLTSPLQAGGGEHRSHDGHTRKRTHHTVKRTEKGQVHRELNRRIVDTARHWRGRRVGDGQCWTFPDFVLRRAGAWHPSAYVWGRRIRDREVIHAGDVIQFEGARFDTGNSYWLMPHHSAVVDEVLGPQTVVLIHQNFGNSAAEKVVRLTEIHLDDLTEGKFTIYRPQYPRK